MTHDFDVAYFAYDVLVNRHLRSPDTHAVPARLKGWTRQWRHCVETPHGRVCTLTAARKLKAEIAGVLVLDRSDRIVEADRRQHGYGYQRIRIDFPRHALVGTLRAIETYIYMSAVKHYRPGHPGTRDFPIWRSYLYCVLAGYLDLGGREAAETFITSTEGWNVPILDDRESPKYSMAVPIAEAMQTEIEQLLEKHGLLNLQFKE